MMSEIETTRAIRRRHEGKLQMFHVIRLRAISVLAWLAGTLRGLV